MGRLQMLPGRELKKGLGDGACGSAWLRCVEQEQRIPGVCNACSNRRWDIGLIINETLIHHTSNALVGPNCAPQAALPPDVAAASLPHLLRWVDLIQVGRGQARNEEERVRERQGARGWKWGMEGGGGEWEKGNRRREGAGKGRRAPLHATYLALSHSSQPAWLSQEA